MPDFKVVKPTRNANELLIQLKLRGLVVDDEKEEKKKRQITRLGCFRLSGYFGLLQSSKEEII